eukprot:SAG31_NODE_11963_length_981_cov_23.195011_1_plen_293_part_10
MAKKIAALGECVGSLRLESPYASNIWGWRTQTQTQTQTRSPRPKGLESQNQKTAFCMYEPATVVDDIDWYTDTLFNAVLFLVLLLNTPERNTAFTVAMLTSTLAAAGQTVGARKSKTELIERLKRLYAANPKTWHDIDLSGQGLLPDLRIQECIQFARRVTGKHSYIIGCGNNGWALKRIIDRIIFLFNRVSGTGFGSATVPGFTSVPDEDHRAKFVKLVFDIDALALHGSTRGLRARWHNVSHFDEHVATVGHSIDSAQGVDMSTFIWFYPQDHGRKALMEMLPRLLNKNIR